MSSRDEDTKSFLRYLEGSIKAQTRFPDNRIAGSWETVMAERGYALRWIVTEDYKILVSCEKI